MGIFPKAMENLSEVKSSDSGDSKEFNPKKPIEVTEKETEKSETRTTEAFDPAKPIDVTETHAPEGNDTKEFAPAKPVEVGEEKNNTERESVESDAIEKIDCINEDLAGKEHPITGVPFVRKQVEVSGKQYEVVVPEFKSIYDAKLPESMYKATDYEQFKECNAQLKDEIATNKDLRKQFDAEQLEQIQNGDTPDGYTWHHDAEAGKMQLVDTETHQKTGHTGGRSIWGGGSEKRKGGTQA